MLTGIYKRIQERLAVVGLDETNASKLAVGNDAAISNIKRGIRAGREGISTKTLVALAKVLDTTPGWLLDGSVAGSEPKRREAAVIGMASCGPEGWARISGSRFKAPVPPELADDPQAFPVLATGESMQPFGLYDGFLCWCSPRLAPEVGDIVCVERAETADVHSLTIKKLGVIGHGSYELIGYHPVTERPSRGSRAAEFQDLFWETVSEAEISRIAVVAHIITRPRVLG